MSRAEDVKPKAWSDILVLFDDGESSVIYGKYCGTYKVAIRWNGGGGTVGYPSQGGNPLWYCLPDYLEVPTVEAVLKELVKGSGPKDHIDNVRKVLLEIE